MVQQRQYEAGRVLGRLTLSAQSGSQWECQCTCGKKVFFCEEDLPSVRSCGCIVVLGLDLATKSGWAVRYSWRSAAAIKCGVFEVKTNDKKEEVSWETKYALVANQTYRLLTEHRPDFVVIEEPQHRVTQFKTKKKDPYTGKLIEAQTINPGALQLSGIAGAAIGICMLMRIPCGTIPARTWHSKYHGKGVTPASGEDWKDVAIRSCELEGIELPRTKADKRDASEAACISGCWHWSSVLDIEWMRKRFIDLRIGASRVLANKKAERQATSDLFAGEAA